MLSNHLRQFIQQDWNQFTSLHEEMQENLIESDE
jgi:hypothetical protein